MKIVNFVLLFVILIWRFEFSSAQTYINDEEVSGIWTRTNSPYIINCDIIVQSNTSLLIENGVKVVFTGAYNMTVEGQIVANGLKNDSICFTSSSERWRGIIFNSNTSTSSSLTFCIIEKSGEKSGGGDQPNFTNLYGGGLSISGKAPIIISNCNIRKNQAFYGGGIYNNNNNAKITNTIIEQNEAWDGSAIYSNTASVYKGCLIINNTTVCGGTLGSKLDVSTIYKNCTIVKNNNPHSWTGVFQIGGYLCLLSSIVYGNSSANCFVNNQNSEIYIAYCDIEGGAETFESNRLIYHDNIETPPIFANISQNDFHLLASPCVNHGEPGFPDMDLYIDIDGNPRIYTDAENRIDIGAFEYQEEISNYPPVIYPIEDRYVLSYSRIYIPVYYFDADNQDSHAVELFANDNVDASITNTLENGFLTLLRPKNNWKGDFYLIVKINDNSNKPGAVYEDSVLIHVGNRFKGKIDSNEVFMDTIKIIGDVIVEPTGNLLIKEGTFVEFQDHYKIEVFGKLNALGSENKRITFNAIDTSTFFISDHVSENGWGGIGFYNINNSDTLRLSYCNINNVGVKITSDGVSLYNGTINIIKSKNIFMDNCIFNSNYTFGDMINSNCGVLLDSAYNIQIRSCTFTNVFSYGSRGAYIYTNNSELIIDSSSFINAYCDDNSLALIFNPNSKLKIRNSYFHNNNTYSLLYLSGQNSRTDIENNAFIRNDANAIIANIADTTVIRNNLFVKNKKAITAGSYVIVIGNIIAYNKLVCNCSNFYGVAIDMSGASGYIANNTIVDNDQDSNGDAIYASYSSPIIVNNLFWKNRGNGFGWYNGYDGPSMGFQDPIFENNYSGDPKFVLADSLDFNLKKESNCIDKGIAILNKYFLNIDIYGNQRIDTVTLKIDIGAVEFQREHAIIPTYLSILSNSFSISPNPVTSYIVIEDSYAMTSFEIFDIKGICVQEGINADNIIDVSSLKDGFYIIRIKNDENYYVAKFLKR